MCVFVLDKSSNTYLNRISSNRFVRNYLFLRSNIRFHSIPNVTDDFFPFAFVVLTYIEPCFFFSITSHAENCHQRRSFAFTHNIKQVIPAVRRTLHSVSLCVYNLLSIIFSHTFITRVWFTTGAGEYLRNCFNY